MTGVLQASLSGGELSPGLWGRTDLARYTTCLELCLNSIVQPYGGIKNRAGFEYLGAVKTAASRVRLLPFIFSEDQAYILEFGNYYIRFWKSGSLQEATTVSAWSGAVTYGSYGIVRSYNGINYYNLVVPNLNHNPASSPSYWYPLTGTVVELPTPYAIADLRDISLAQSADTVYLAHQDYAPRVLKRWGERSWSIEELDYINGPFSVVNTSTDGLRISATTGSITITNAGGNGIFTDTNIGQLLYIESKNYTEPWQTNVGITINSIRRSDGKYYKAVNGGITGTLKPVHTRGVWSDGVVSWEYLNSGWGAVRITSVAVGGVVAYGTVINTLPDDLITNASEVWAWCDWGGYYGYPGAVCLHQQRLVFGGSPGFPETLWMSRTGAYNDYVTSAPIVDDDSLSVTLAANNVHEIRGLLSMNNLIITTSGGAWILGTGEQDAITPSNVSARLQSFRGAAKLDPLGVGRSALYLQAKGQIIRDLSFETASQAYQSFDLTLLASHLFEGYEVLDWAWQESPFQTLWVVRDDGILLTAVYVKEQEVLGWAQQDLGGVVESVCVLPEGNENVVYVSILRTVNGSDVRYIERMSSRYIEDITDAFFVDSGLKFDNTDITGETITLSGGTNWDEGETITLTASGTIFAYPALTDIGDQIVMELSDGTMLRLTIEGVTSALISTVRPNMTIPVIWRNAALTGWNFARDTYEIAHLIGETVSILADGFVQEQQNVSATGTVILDPPAIKASIGLPYNSDLKTLDPAINTPETPMDKKKNITQVRFMVRESRNIKAGRDFDTLYQVRSRNTEIYDAVPQIQTGIVSVSIPCTWEPRGVVCLRQDEPLPINWIALIPEITIGGK